METRSYRFNSDERNWGRLEGLRRLLLLLLAWPFRGICRVGLPSGGFPWRAIGRVGRSLRLSVFGPCSRSHSSLVTPFLFLLRFTHILNNIRRSSICSKL